MSKLLKSRRRNPPPAPSGTAPTKSTGPTSRGQAIAAAAAGLLATVGGVSAVGAVTVPDALPACPTEGNCVSSTSFKLVRREGEREKRTDTRG